WHGNLYLRGDGDPTFGDGGFNRVYERGEGPTAAEFVAQLRRDGIKPATGNQPDTPDYGGELSALVYDHGDTSGKLTPATFAARELALSLRAQKVRAFAATVAKRSPRGAHTLAGVASPPPPRLLSVMG